MLGYYIEKIYFKHIDTIEFWGKAYKSVYNNNYYYSLNYNCLILEECHEFESYNSYTLITKNKVLYLWEWDIEEGFSNEDSKIIKINNRDILR